MTRLEQGLATMQLMTHTERRYDVDALRVILFGMLIWLHYVSLCTWTQQRHGAIYKQDSDDDYQRNASVAPRCTVCYFGHGDSVCFRTPYLANLP